MKAIAAALACAGALAAGPAGAVAQEAGTFTFGFENDRVAETDRHFTHGTLVTWVSPRGGVPAAGEGLMDALPLVFEAGAGRRLMLSLGQSIFTPDDTRARAVVRDDRPYAGWLYMGAGLLAESARRLQRLSLQVGVVGPPSGAEQVQTAVHELIDVTIPEGWDNQLDSEPGAVAFYETKWRRVLALGRGGYGLEVGPHAAFALGNVLTYGGAGASVRFGQDLGDDFGPPRIRPAIPGAGFFEPSDAFAWNVFAGLEARAVARNIFLDGSTFSESHSVDKRPVVVDVQAGFALRYRDLRLAFTHVLRTPEFEAQGELDAFGAVSLSLRL